MLKLHSTWVITVLFFFMTMSLPVSAEEPQENYTREHLAQMVAPIALYPDALLSQVLIAATYPLEIVEAERWLKKSGLLTREGIDEALVEKDWDVSVKALCHVPKMLALMSERLAETTNLGNAFLAQEGEVMEVIQELRDQAYQEGNLKSTDQQKVTRNETKIIVIEPSDPQIVYVPYYNTRYVYGSWGYPDWPPWYWGPQETVVGAGIFFWPDYYVGFGLGFGYWSSFDWPHRTIIINVQHRPRFIRHDYDWDSYRGRWHHEPHHRRGVIYRDRRTAERYGQPASRNRVYDRRDRGDSADKGTNRSTRGNRDDGPGRQPNSTRQSTVVSPTTVRSSPANVTPRDQTPRPVVRGDQNQGREIVTIPDGVDNDRVENRSGPRDQGSRGPTQGQVIQRDGTTPDNQDDDQRRRR
ncbi:MAG: DUF3300 domain-containing protein [Proteobacteria bacterium]|nr:DUF3300 domain-containing protein [Pseudomonadota bacterium]